MTGGSSNDGALGVLDLLSDGHVHSTFSDDAVSTIEENLAAARGRGLRSLTMVDHVRSTTSWVPEFVTAARGAASTAGVNVVVGVETKLLDSAGGLDLPKDAYRGEGGLDAIVVGDHQFPGPDGPWSPREVTGRIENGLAVSDVLDMYIDASIAAMLNTQGLQLAHWFSILPKIGLAQDQLGDDHLDAWAAAAFLSGARVEVNEKWRCPNARALTAALAHGVPLVAASDSHHCEDVGRYLWVRDIAAELEDVEARRG